MPSLKDYQLANEDSVLSTLTSQVFDPAVQRFARESLINGYTHYLVNYQHNPVAPIALAFIYSQWSRCYEQQAVLEFIKSLPFETFQHALLYVAVYINDGLMTSALDQLSRSYSRTPISNSDVTVLRRRIVCRFPTISQLPTTIVRTTARPLTCTEGGLSCNVPPLQSMSEMQFLPRQSVCNLDSSPSAQSNYSPAMLPNIGVLTANHPYDAALAVSSPEHSESTVASRLPISMITTGKVRYPFLIYAPPYSGKSYFASKVGRTLVYDTDDPISQIDIPSVVVTNMHHLIRYATLTLAIVPNKEEFIKRCAFRGLEADDKWYDDLRISIMLASHVCDTEDNVTQVVARICANTGDVPWSLDQIRLKLRDLG